MPTNFKIRLTEDYDAKTWNAYVERHHDSGPYHLWEWREAVHKAYGHTAYYLIAQKKDCYEPVGLLPLHLIKSPLAKGELVSLPFCDYGGPLADTLKVALLLCEHAKDLADSMKTKLEIRCNQRLTVSPVLSSFGNKVRMLLDLPGSSDTLFKQFKSKLRSQIRRPIKEGFYSKLGGLELVQDFYTVFRINMRDLGSPVHSLKWFKALAAFYDQKIKIGVVYKEEIPVAGGVILLHNETVSIPWASSLRSYNHLSPNMLLYWSFLEYAADNGYKKFDFGRSSPDSGTFRFKKQWGAVPHPVFWYKNSDSEGKIPADGKMREKAEKFWRKLPISLATFLGPRIRKYISL